MKFESLMGISHIFNVILRLCTCMYEMYSMYAEKK